MPKLFLACCLCLIHLLAVSQKKNANFELPVHPASSAILLDGIINETAWQEAQATTDFFMVLPMDTSYARLKTEVKMCYDSRNLYLLAVCHTTGIDMVQSLRRDFEFGKNDNFLVFIDPFEDQTNGFAFGTNAAGAQWDGLMYEGGKVDLSWDNKWSSAVKRYNDRWILEMAIPFKTLRFKKGISHWGINFSRNDLKRSEKSSWAPVPRQFPTASLAYTGSLVWDHAPEVPAGNISLFPYVLGGIVKNHESPQKETSRRFDLGGDAKIAITSSLNLDLTFNPDFSQDWPRSANRIRSKAQRETGPKLAHRCYGYADQSCKRNRPASAELCCYSPPAKSIFPFKCWFPDGEQAVAQLQCRQRFFDAAVLAV